MHLWGVRGFTLHRFVIMMDSNLFLFFSSFFDQVHKIVRSPRQLYMKWIDRPDPSNYIELSSVRVGRDVYSLLCFDPGFPYHGKICNSVLFIGILDLRFNIISNFKIVFKD